jgi:hypothetical protein
VMQRAWNPASQRFDGPVTVGTNQAERAGYEVGLAHHSDFGRRSYSGEARMDWWRGYRAGLRDAGKSSAASRATYPGGSDSRQGGNSTHATHG